MGEGEPQPLTGEYPEPNASAPLDSPVHNCFSHLKATVHPCAIKDGNDDDEESHMGQTYIQSTIYDRPSEVPLEEPLPFFLLHKMAGRHWLPGRIDSAGKVSTFKMVASAKYAAHTCAQNTK